MSFRQIGQIALDGVDGSLLARIKRHTEATGSAMLDRSPVAPLTLEGGARQRMGETGKVTGANPGQVNREVSQSEGQIATLNPPTIGRDMATARRAEPHGSAVVISLAMYRAQRHAAPRSMTD